MNDGKRVLNLVSYTSLRVFTQLYGGNENSIPKFHSLQCNNHQRHFKVLLIDRRDDQRLCGIVVFVTLRGILLCNALLVS